MRPPRTGTQANPAATRLAASRAWDSPGGICDGRFYAAAKVRRFAALAFAQRTLAAAEIFAGAAGLILRFVFVADGAEEPEPGWRCFAQRNFWAAPILARAAGLIFLRGPAAPVADSPEMAASSFWSASIRSRMERARFNCCADKACRLLLINYE